MPLWQPTPEQINQANLTRFISCIEKRRGLAFSDYHAFYHWTVAEPAAFWAELWDFCGVISSEPYDEVLVDADRMPGARWFVGASMNFAENLLRFRDDSIALVFWGEDRVRREMTYADLYGSVAKMASHLKSLGITSGDRVAGMVPNIPEAVIAMLATASLGAIWSSCSPDFGVPGVVDRFGQIEPKLLVAADGYYFKGRTFSSLDKVAEISALIPSIESVIVADLVGEGASFDFKSSHAATFTAMGEILDVDETPTLEFAQVPFDHPLYIMYSSGTTGKPKCILHGVGGTLITHLRELVLHTDLRRDSCIFYATTCGWMMWNWLVSSLATGASVVLYDGSPVLRDHAILFDLVDAEQVTVFGTSAGFVASLRRIGLRPIETHSLQSLDAILSTGSPLVPESFDYVYEHVKRDVRLSSISGGTDIIGCFALGCPTIPVHRGELQTRSLGCAVDVFDNEGRSLAEEKGELVCTSPFPSMPLGFWDDPDGSKYHNAYFERFDNVWHHGDYVRLTEHGGMEIYGRSDATLNPGGVRIGTAEIYRQVESIDRIENSVVIGQRWDGDTRVVLFVKMQPGAALDEELCTEIKQTIRRGASPRHVPARILQVADIPMTRSGKVSELAVSDLVHGRPLKNIEALANPECLDGFRELEALRN